MEVNIMYSKKALPVGTMFLVLVIALALLGVGYALWSETLTIQGTVQTGEVDVEFSTHPVEECIDINGVLTCPEPLEKADAANCTVEFLGGETDPNGDNGANLLQVTVTGMYPSYHCKVGFDVTSTGNVPVHVWLPEATGDIPAWVATNFEDCYTAGIQLHEGQSTGLCTMDIHFTNDQAPPENSGPITFGWTILATQFNEDPAPPADIITVTSANLNFSATGWGGWSCSVPDHPYVVSATTNCAGSLTQYLWEPGATTGSVNYPNTPFGYTYTPPEEGSIVQMGGTAQTCNIILQCSDQP
jgi:hypothetical protein